MSRLTEKKKNLLWLGVVFTAIALIVSGYLRIGGRMPISNDSTTVREKIRLGLSLDPTMSLIIAANELGFFSEEGLDVTIAEFPSGKRSLEALFNGKVDVATPSDTAAVFGSFDRHDFSIIASVASSESFEKVIARKDKGIGRAEDLRGKRIATQEASAVHFFLHLFLLKHGLSERDITLSFMKPEELPQALYRGEIDAFSMREPFISRAVELLGDNGTVFGEKEINTRSDLLVVLKSFLSEKPDAVDKLLKALSRAEVFSRKEPGKAIRIVSNKLRISESEMAAIWQCLNLKVSIDQELILDLEDIARWAIDNELTTATAVPNYLDFIHLTAMERLRPEAVTVYR